VSVPTFRQLTPSDESHPVSVEPLRWSFSHTGGKSHDDPAVRFVDPPAESRRSKLCAVDSANTIDAYGAFASSVERIMMPAFHGIDWEFESAGACAMITVSPVTCFHANVN